MDTDTPSVNGHEGVVTGNEGHRAVARALHALEVTVASEEGLTLTELASLIGAAKSSLHPLLKALVFRGYLTYDGVRYRAGRAIGTLSASESLSLVSVAKPFVGELRRQFNETVSLGTMVGETLIYLHNEESDQVVRYSPPRVRPMSQHPSSMGKLYLTQLSEADLQVYIEHHVHADKRALLVAEIHEARSTGVAFNRGESYPDLGSVAARIMVGGQVVACLAIGGPIRRMKPREGEMAAALQHATSAIESLVERPVR
ncbi:IclR family transcriptional regulator [Rhodococcus koreensis]|uniref:IclR family transcriptional regulator n=1 Tax=Rhodococcus koreensis TaxID=99653 RepID=UPI00366C256D